VATFGGGNRRDKFALLAGGGGVDAATHCFGPRSGRGVTRLHGEGGSPGPEYPNGGCPLVSEGLCRYEGRHLLFPWLESRPAVREFDGGKVHPGRREDLEKSPSSPGLG